MDERRFDELVRSLGRGLTRRKAARTGVGAAIAAAAGLFATGTGEARERRDRDKSRGKDKDDAPVERDDETGGDVAGAGERSRGGAAADGRGAAEDAGKGKGRGRRTCRKPGKPCKKGDRCCGGVCRQGRCVCRGSRKPCGSTCIAGDDCCTGNARGCPANETCVNGECTGVGGCVPDCAGKECGSDGCEGSCGSCGQNEACNDQTGQCETTCAPQTCAQQDIVCGPATDGCGGSLACGDCPNARPFCVDNGARCVECTADAQCRSAQRPNGVCDAATGTCACTPETACPSGRVCGEAPDGCGGTIPCGSCPSGEPNCVDDGTRCVACTSDADCTGGGECQIGTCSNGTCAYANKDNGTTCGSGAGAGVCCGGACNAGQECCTDAQCGSSTPRCSANGRCVACTADDQCTEFPNSACDEQSGACTCEPVTSCPSGRICDSIDDRCGGSLSCGTCPTSRPTCVGGVLCAQCTSDAQCTQFPNSRCDVVAGSCVCAPNTACPNGRICGAADDGCGGTVQCAGCPTGTPNCVDGGTRCVECVEDAQCRAFPNSFCNEATGVCGCTPITSCPAGRECGAVPNGCGGQVSCGDCPTRECQTAVACSPEGLCQYEPANKGQACGDNNAGVCLNGTCQQLSNNTVACNTADACGANGVTLCGPSGSPDSCVCYSTVEGGGLCVRRADGCQPGDPNDPGTCQNFCPPLTPEGQTLPPSDRPECNTSAECDADSVCVRLDQDPGAQPNCCGGDRTKRGFCVDKASRCAAAT